MVRVVSLSHQIVGSKQPLRRFCEGKACLGLSLPQTPLMWEPPALGLPFLCWTHTPDTDFDAVLSAAAVMFEIVVALSNEYSKIHEDCGY